MIQYSVAELMKFNTKENTALACENPDFLRVRNLLKTVVRKNQDYGYSEVYGYFEEKSKTVKEVEKALEEKMLKNKRKNYLRRQRAKKVKALRKQKLEQVVEEKVSNVKTDILQEIQEKRNIGVKLEKELNLNLKFKNSRLFKRNNC